MPIIDEMRVNVSRCPHGVEGRQSGAGRNKI
jgi:hypothetical protein